MSDYWFLCLVIGATFAGFIWGFFSGHSLVTRWYYEDRAAQENGEG